MADVDLENAASPESQLVDREVEQRVGIKNGSSKCCRKSYTVRRTSLVETKWKSLETLECLVSAYRIGFEQAEEHTGLTDEEEEKPMKKGG